MRLPVHALFLALLIAGGSALAGHDNVEVDPALRRYAGTVRALGGADAAGRIRSFGTAPLGPEAPAAYLAGELRGWRLTMLTGKRFASAFEIEGNAASEITVTPAGEPLNGVAVGDVFFVEEIALAK